MDDIELLQQYAAENSQEAFATLVSRHVNMVYSVAMRQLNDSHHAEEVTQAVFVILARKAGSLRKGTIVSGWLFHTSRLTAKNFLRGEIRRKQREQEAYMQLLSNENESDIWPQIAPLLDDAMANLGQKDRDAIALRFFEGKNLREVGARLGVSEDAAKMRVGRAVEKLRGFFTKRGVVLSAAVVGNAIAAHSIQAAPASLVASATVAATQGISLSTSTATLIKGTLKIMAWTKTKIALTAATAILFAAGTSSVVLSKLSDDRVAAQKILQRAKETYASLSTYSASGKTISEFKGGEIDIPNAPAMAGKMVPPPQQQMFRMKLGRPNLYKIEWEQKVTPTYTSQGAVWSAGNGDFVLLVGKVRKERSRETAFSSSAGVSGAATITVPSAFFDSGLNSVLSSFATAKDLALEREERINGVSCYVLSRTAPAPKNPGFDTGKEMRTMLWIGKDDHLIHQHRVIFKDFKVNLPGTAGSLAAKEMISTQTYLETTVNEPLSPEEFVVSTEK